MTGKHTGHGWVRGNRQVSPAGEYSGQYPLAANEVTVATLLQKAGYATGQFGKWGLGMPGTEGDPQRHGFDTFFGYYCQTHAHNSFPEFLYHDRVKQLLRNKVVYMPKSHWTRGVGSYSTIKREYSNDLIFDHDTIHRGEPDGAVLCLRSGDDAPHQR